ncbi:MAG: hypothetical protein LUD39_04755, partial [Opitutae bacterium]|nr:hypothetical protein [Opitutae bacterium]
MKDLLKKILPATFAIFVAAFTSISAEAREFIPVAEWKNFLQPSRGSKRIMLNADDNSAVSEISAKEIIFRPHKPYCVSAKGLGLRIGRDDFFVIFEVKDLLPGARSPVFKFEGDCAYGVFLNDADNTTATVTWNRSNYLVEGKQAASADGVLTYA